MTTVPSEEATATSISTHGDSGSSESPTLGSQSQASVRAEVPVASSTAVTAEWQDVQVSIKPTTSEAVSLSGDKDKHEDTAGFSREPRLAHLAPGPPQMSMSLQNQARDGPVQDARMTQSFQIFQHGSLVNEETPQTAGVPDGEQELARNTPSAVVQSPQSASIASIAEADIQLDTLATGTTEAVEEPEHPEALHPDSEALPLAEFQVVPELDVADYSGELQAPPSPRGSVPPSSGGSAPPSPKGSVTPSLGGSTPPTPRGSVPPSSGGSAPPSPRGSATPSPGGSTPPTPRGSVPPSSGGSAPPSPRGSGPPSPGGSTPPSPRGSVPPLPGPSMVALGRPLDASLYMASGEDNYLHSMTSLLAGGEGSIRSLADVLVWSEDTLGMATGLLASGRGSVTDLLRSTGPRLRSASSILRNASLAISSGLTAGTHSAMLCITRMLERAEQRTIEGIRSAVRYLTSHLTPR